ncbi:amidohydrolase family protein [Fredinandcohnia onubensis]|uniref:amidohydrolase family protein n=1 Tax=Fredinandcohnia onubensis TaxID=1571209 RepID=UPI000C0BD101|nr:amidohydrolase family protein [Fredinandcohnia onubensis]
MRIDAHQHYWKISRDDYGWIKPDNHLMYRDYYPSDLLPHLTHHNINKTVLIQAAPTYDESIFLLQLSNNVETVAAVVTWLELNDPKFKEQLEVYKKYRKFAGIRVMIQDMTDETIILSERYVNAFKYLEKINLPVDLLVTHNQLDTLNLLLKKVPNLRGGIDHIGKPDIANKSYEAWFNSMDKLSNYRNLFCKTSGMITEASTNWKMIDFKRYLSAVLELFGTDRLMFGSDWPVCLLSGTYDEAIEVVRTNLGDQLNSLELEKLFGRNASRFYKLE